jgi:quercetin dioxygenase-like cupin family protein
MAEKNINVLKWDDIPRVKRGRGIVNHPIATKELGARAIHSGITIMPAHTRVPDHTHNAEEQVTILQGSMKIILDGDREVICSKYDSTFIGPDVRHELINDFDEEVHALITYGSPDVNRTFSDTGKTVILGSPEDTFDDNV